ncbi:hypothetical protein ACLQ2D_33375 [Streptomyces sp. DT199]|uniref:hypothetical protein n=1 Tax=Streptomyces TaxID=1883 RepID=UPI000A77F7DB|nr:hypothetical protein [Streptomyces sp. NRRL S-146]
MKTTLTAKVTRRAISLFAAAAAVVGTCLATATPAQAFPYWQEVNTGPNWTCSPFKTHRLSFNIKFKTCIVRNSSNGAQSVLVVQNSSANPVQIRGEVDEVLSGGSWGSGYDIGTFACKLSTLNSGFTRGCFGITYSGTTRITSTSTLFMNGSEEANATQDSWYG